MNQNVVERALPPTDSTTDPKRVVQSSATGAAAANIALWSGYAAGAAPEGKCYVYFEALTQDAYVRFKTANSAAGTTTANGVLLKAGVPRTFILDPSKHVYADVIAGGVGTLKWYVQSTPIETYKAVGT